MPRPNLDAIRKREKIIQRESSDHVEYTCETPYGCHENVRLLLGDLDALLEYVDELEEKHV